MSDQQRQHDFALDAPQLAIGRYFELLRRRWWQVVPISILGLIIGAISAAMVPRYYVCWTRVHYEGSTFDNKSGTLEDPMANEMRAAQERITSLDIIERAVQEVGWRETGVEARRRFIKKVQDEMVVLDLNAGERQRTFFVLEIRYRNLDGQYAADLTNAVRDVWMNARLSKLDEEATREESRVVQRLTRARSDRDRLHGDMTELERIHEVDWSLEPSNDPGRSRLTASEKVREIEGEVLAIDEELAIARDKLQVEQDYIKNLEPTLKKRVESVAETTVNENVAQLQQQLLTAETNLSSITAAHADHLQLSLQVQRLRKELATLGVSDATQSREPTFEYEQNPEYQLARKGIAALEKEVERLEKQLADRRLALAAAELRVAKLKEVRKQWDRMAAEREQAKRDAAAYTEKLREVNTKAEKIRSNQVLRVVARAQVPEAPTEPSILVLAVMGCLLGLAAAIGLVLAWDFIQATFKTVDEVERALPIPVLGTMAHLETREERVATNQSRRRVSLAAGTFLFLFLSIVTVYYVAPTRLPGPVRNALDLLLSGPS